MTPLGVAASAAAEEAGEAEELAESAEEAPVPTEEGAVPTAAVMVATGEAMLAEEVLRPGVAIMAAIVPCPAARNQHSTPPMRGEDKLVAVPRPVRAEAPSRWVERAVAPVDLVDRQQVARVAPK